MEEQSCEICWGVPCDSHIIIDSLPDDPANEYFMCESCHRDFYLHLYKDGK